MSFVVEQQQSVANLPEESAKMLVQFANAPKGLTKEAATAGLGLSHARKDYYFDQLRRRKFVRLCAGRTGSEIRFSATPEGRDCLAAAGLL